LFLQNLKKRAEEIIVANIDSEINYIFTNDEEYLETRTKLIPAGEKKEKEREKTKKGKEDPGEPATAFNDTKDNRERLKK
jgi:hypothetical protein